MLRQLFNRFQKPISLGLAPDGIAMFERGQARILTPQIHATAEAWQAVFEQHAAILSNRPLRLVLANRLVHFVVLPWQEAIPSREDWQAIALHQFKEKFGNLAATWQIKVHLGAYGEPVIAVAMAQNLYQDLQNAAKHIGAHWVEIVPAAQYQLSDSRLNNAQWMLMVEPEFVLLCERQAGQLLNTVSVSPPAGQEALACVQLVQRHQVYTSQTPAPTTLVNVSGKFGAHAEQFAAQVSSFKSANLVSELPRQTYTSHAAWLAQLGGV